MSNRVTKLLSGLGLMGLMLAGALAGGTLLAARPAQASMVSASAGLADAAKVGDKVKITLKDGSVVEGEVVEVTETGWRVKVSMGIGSTVKTVERADYKSIEMADGSPADGGSAGGGAGKPSIGPGSGGGAAGRTAPTAKKADETVVYFVRLTGKLGHDLSPTPLRTVLKGAREAQADYIIFELDMDFIVGGREQKEYYNRGGAQDVFNQLELCRELETLMTDDINNNPLWTTRPKVVMWIKKGLGSPAFLALPIRDLYFHPEGHLGGIGYLDLLFEGVGDEVAREKQRGLRLGRVLGLSNKGGYDRRVLEAMMRGDYALSYRMVGGKPVFFENQEAPPDAFVLSNGGTPRDTGDDLVRMKGKNVLTLDAQTALNLGVSKGTVATLDQLLSAMGIERNFTVVRDQGERELRRWRETILRAETDIRNLWARFQNTEINGETPARRNAQRDQRIGALNRIKTILAEYGEAISGEVLPVGNDPVSCARQLDVIIEQLQAQKRNDRPAPGAGPGGGGRGPAPAGP